MEAKMKLTDTQLMILSKASQREDRAVECPSNLKRGALKAFVTKLLDRGLVNEVAATRGMPAWRQDDDGGSFGLVITRAGLNAIAAEPDEPAAAEPAAGDVQAKSGSGVRGRKPRAKPISGAAPAGERRTAPVKHTRKQGEFRAGSKQALILSMLQRKTGANLADLVSATGWLPHTTRAALTGLRKRGHVLERSRPEGKLSVYRVVQRSAQSTAA
jgi:hypothetical protein